MSYVAEFAGSLVFLLGGYAYMCNVTLKKTLVSALNYVELVIAWSLAVGLGLTVAVIMGGPAYLNPGVVFGQIIVGGPWFWRSVDLSGNGISGCGYCGDCLSGLLS